jgi:hypothetical protein
VTVHVLAGTAVDTPVGVNPFVTLTPGAISRSSTAGSAAIASAALALQSATVVSSRALIAFTAAPVVLARTPEEEAQDEIARAHGLGDAWLAGLEQRAQEQWRALVQTPA